MADPDTDPDTDPDGTSGNFKPQSVSEEESP